MLTKAEFIERRDAALARAGLDIANREHRVWLAHYLWADLERRHQRTSHKSWKRWLGPPDNPHQRAIRLGDLERMANIPAWLIQADIREYRHSRYLARCNPDHAAPEPDVYEWPVRGSAALWVLQYATAPYTRPTGAY